MQNELSRSAVEKRRADLSLILLTVLMTGAGCSSRNDGTNPGDSGADCDAGFGVSCDASSEVGSDSDVGSDVSPSSPALVASTTVLPSFARVALGKSSAEASFTIRNEGQLTSGVLTLDSTNDEFRIGAGSRGDCTPGMVLDAGASCTVRVTFAPTAVGERSGAIMFAAAGSGGGNVVMTGSGITPTALSRFEAIFWPVAVGSTQQKTFRIRNTGQETSPPITTSLNGNNPRDFVVLPPTGEGDCVYGTTTLAEGAECAVNIAFSPTAGGNRYAAVSLSGGAGMVQLTGIGIATYWTQASPPPTDGTAAMRLPDGRVLLVGRDETGWTPALGQLDDPYDGMRWIAELYDPATDTWTTSGSIAIRRIHEHYSATLLPDGKVLALGYEKAEAYPGSFSVRSCAAIYDLAQGTWSRLAPPLPTGSDAVLLPNGKVLATGGWQGVLYDPATGEWSSTGPGAHEGMSPTLLANGKVLLMNRPDSETARPRYPELYDPAANEWSAIEWTSQWSGGAAVLLGNGKVLITGGNGSTQAALFDPTTSKWSAIEGMWFGRTRAAMTVLDNGKVLVTGGCSDFAELYDPEANKWSVSGARMRAKRCAGTATLLANGKVLVTGEGSAELYDPAVDFSPAANSFGSPQNAY